MKKLVILATLVIASHAADRTVLLAWTPAVNSVPVTFNMYRCQVTVLTNGCSPNVIINASPITGSTYQDLTAVVGNSYQYGVAAVGPACTGLQQGPCGSSTITVRSEILFIAPRPNGPSPTSTVSVTATGKGMVAVLE